MHTDTALPHAVTIVGLGEVGTCFARGLLDCGVRPRVMSRASERSASAAASLGLSLEANARAAVADAEVVLLAVTSESLLDVVRALAPHLKPEALLADLTASSADATRAAAAAVAGGSDSFVDVAVMGAVSLHGIRTPLLAAGPAAPRFAGIMNALGFNVEPWPGSTVGDASDLKLLRSVFTKGLEAVVIESMLAAEALGLRTKLTQLLSDYDRRPLRDHIEMYMRTHPGHAERRLPEMLQAETQILGRGLPSLTTRAAIERYRRTVALQSDRSVATQARNAAQAIAWLLELERLEHENAPLARPGDFSSASPREAGP
jgi:3-hydroxyisobutyrate dehydrogenase-like beta-hydroxyacid dehydrogenase